MSKKLKVKFAEPEYDYSNRKVMVGDFLPPRNKKEYAEFIKRLKRDYSRDYEYYASTSNLVEGEGCRSDIYLDMDKDFLDVYPINLEEFLLWCYRQAVLEVQLDAISYL